MGRNSSTAFRSSANSLAEAHSILAPVYEWFSEGHYVAELRAARALVSELRE